MAEAAVLRVRLTPKGGRNALLRWEDELLYARVAAPPVEGEANRALISLLADQLHHPRSRFEIISGHSSRLKTLMIQGLTSKELSDRILASLPTVKPNSGEKNAPG